MNSVFTATVEKIETRRDGTLKVSLGTQVLIEEAERSLFSLRRKGEGVKCFLSSDNITEEQAKVMDDLPVEAPKGKTPSQRLRAVLYRLWEQRASSLTFDEYYADKIETLIDHYKAKLDELQ